MFPKQTVIGIFVAKAVPQIKINRSDSSRIGYAVVPSILIRSNIKFLKDIKVSLSHLQIESKITDVESNTRPSPLLVVSGESMRTLNKLIPDFYSSNKDWQQFKIILSMMERKEHLTLNGLETIMTMKGIL
tara:strand:- start:1149 stop:1541 length:393 start_codon:yes stop_codon:yes gene_type:complete